MTRTAQPTHAPPADSSAAGGDVVLRIEHLHRVYETDGGFTHTLKDISFDVTDGEFVSVVGQSGCGKSTLLNLIAGLDRPSHGGVQLNGVLIDGPESRHMGYVFQHTVLLPWRRIMDNALLPSELMRLDTKRLRTRAHELLKLVGLQGFEQRFPHQLSGGMQQRASIVRALIHEPKVLLMDEPFGALDALTRERMNLELLKIWKTTGTTIVFVTHDLREAAFLSDRIVVMSARPGTVREVVTSNLPRPRDRETMFSSEFRDLTHHLGDLIA